MDEPGLEEALLAGDQEMVHDAVTEVGGEDFAGLGTVGDETDRAPWTIGVCPQLLL